MPAPDSSPTSVVQRWTLAAVLAATAILMLDIAVVNTALPTLQVDLNTDLHALKWVLDAYTLALASVVLTAGSLADRYRPPPAVRARRDRLHRVLGRRGRFRLDRVPDRRSCGPGPRRRVDVRRLARAAEPRVPHAAGAHGRVRRLRRHDRRLLRARPVRRRSCSPSALGWEWVFLVNVPIGLVVLAIAAFKLVESRDPHPPKIDFPGQITLVGRPVRARLRPAQRGRGRLGRRPRRRRAGAAAVGLLSGVHRDRGHLARADGAARHVPQPALRGRAARRDGDLRGPVLDLHLHHDLPAGREGLLADGGRPGARPGHDGEPVLRGRRRRRSGHEGPAGGADRGRPRARLAGHGRSAR